MQRSYSNVEVVTAALIVTVPSTTATTLAIDQKVGRIMLIAIEVQNIPTPRELCTAVNPASVTEPPQKLTELLAQIETQGTRNFPALKSKLPLIAELLNKTPDQVTIQDLEGIKPGFRSFLVKRRLAENSIRAYVYEVGFLLKYAKLLGWRPTVNVPPAWVTVRQNCIDKKCTNLVTYLMSKKKSPAQVTPEDVESWIAYHVGRGGSLKSSRNKKTDFWKIMASCGFGQVLLKERYSIPLRELPEPLKADVKELVRWKTADFEPGRSKKAKIREVTSRNLEKGFCSLYGFIHNIIRDPEAKSISELVTPDMLNRYVAWAINERVQCGQSVIGCLCGIKAALCHPKYQYLVGPWFSELVGGIEPESESELKEKQAAKQVPYTVAETIPTLICAGRKNAARRGEKGLAIVIRDQLLMLWLIVLPWRRRNLSGCRIEGPQPNLFKAKLDLYAPISKTNWVEEALKADPEAEFWQCKFSGKETKAGNTVHILLPRPLIPLLEEYLRHRKQLLGDADSNSLFLNREGTTMSEQTLTNLVSELSLRHIGKAVSPHTFRHIVAYGWLKDHPGDYLTVSKLLFHKNLKTTISTYASRFNESDGACGMEKWFESRH